MDSRELLNRLVREGFNPLAYWLQSLDAGDGRDDCLCLRRIGPRWDVFYTERGIERILATYAAEADACEGLYEFLAREPHSKSHLLASFGDETQADDAVALLRSAGISPTHRDAPIITSPSDVRYRIFVNGRDIARAREVLTSVPAADHS